MKACVQNAYCSARLAIVVTVLLIWFGRPADALDCKSLPPGPEKKQCLTQNKPEAFQKKQARCKELAEQRGGALQGRGTGKKLFLQSCMQGKVSG